MTDALTGKYGGVHCELPNGVTFDCGSGFDDALRRRPPAIGSIIEFKYQGKSNSGTPRFPTFLRQRVDLTWADVVAAAAMPAAAAIIVRPACPYGAQCYRTRNARHMADLTH